METLKIISGIYTIAYLFTLPGMWMVFKKFGINPWLSLLPVFNIIVIMNFYEMSMWYMLMLLFLPLTPFLMVLINYKVSKSLGQGIGFTIGLSLWFTCPIFINLLGFGNYEFIGKEGLI